MKILVSSRSNTLNDTVRHAICDRLQLALSQFSPSIEAVTVRIGDVRGPSGDSRQLCRLSVRMKRLGSFLVDSVEQQITDAVSRAADRAARQLERILDGHHGKTGSESGGEKR